MSRPTGVTKQFNEYAGVLSGKLYEQTPKAVFAAMAVSLASCGGDRLDEAERALMHEWWCLFNAGIVPQKPPFKDPQELT